MIPVDRRITYEQKEITLEADITCEGRLVFENCVIEYKPFDNQRHIIIKDGGTVTISKSTVQGIVEKCSARTEDSIKKFLSKISHVDSIDYFIRDETQHENHAHLDIDGCSLVNCSKLANVFCIRVKGSTFEYTEALPIATKILSTNEESDSRIDNCICRHVNKERFPRVYDLNTGLDVEVEKAVEKLREKHTEGEVLKLLQGYEDKGDMNEMFQWLNLDITPIESFALEHEHTPIFENFSSISDTTFEGFLFLCP